MLKVHTYNLPIQTLTNVEFFFDPCNDQLYLYSYMTKTLVTMSHKNIDKKDIIVDHVEEDHIRAIHPWTRTFLYQRGDVHLFNESLVIDYFDHDSLQSMVYDKYGNLIVLHAHLVYIFNKYGQLTRSSYYIKVSQMLCINMFLDIKYNYLYCTYCNLSDRTFTLFSCHHIDQDGNMTTKYEFKMKQNLGKFCIDTDLNLVMFIKHMRGGNEIGICKLQHDDDKVEMVPVKTCTVPSNIYDLTYCTNTKTLAVLTCKENNLCSIELYQL